MRQVKGVNVETVKAQITDFLNKCEELKHCKFIMATAKIKDLLKAIVNSSELYELFNTVANDFDYPAVKQRCFIEGSPCRVVLPDTVGERLAFIFCMLVEFDRNDINFNAFLQKYYAKDGSFYSSYRYFCDEVIVPLQNIVCDVFAAELESREEEVDSRYAEPVALPCGEYSATAALLIEAEMQAVAESDLSADDKEAATLILNSMERALKSFDKSLVQALACGYNYFVLYSNFVSPTVSELMEELSRLV